MTPDSFGDVTGEYEAIHEAAGVIGSLHAAVRVTGPDAETFLDSLLSQDLSGLRNGVVVRSLLLGPRGKMRALLWLARFDDEFVLVTDQDAAGSVIEDLTRFKLRVDLTIGEAEPVVDLIGPEASQVLEAAGRVDGPSVLRTGLGRLERLFVIDAGIGRLVEAGARQVGRLAYTATRVEMGEPAMGQDIDESTIPQEADLVAEAVSLTKGCYLGQELVARIDSRGHVNRHLRGLVLAENALPPPGAEVVAGDRSVGVITSVSESLIVGAPVGLGLIRREVEPGSEVDIRWEGGHARAQVRSLPLV